MKNCPNCNSEVDDHFELCWNCSYSFSEKKIIDLQELNASKSEKEIDCLRCKVPMRNSGQFKFHEGTPIGVFGSIFELLQNRKSFDLYHCPNCRKVEFFIPEH